MDGGLFGFSQPFYSNGQQNNNNNNNNNNRQNQRNPTNPQPLSQNHPHHPQSNGPFPDSPSLSESSEFLNVYSDRHVLPSPSRLYDPSPRPISQHHQQQQHHLHQSQSQHYPDEKSFALSSPATPTHVYSSNQQSNNNNNHPQTVISHQIHSHSHNQSQSSGDGGQRSGGGDATPPTMLWPSASTFSSPSPSHILATVQWVQQVHPSPPSSSSLAILNCTQKSLFTQRIQQNNVEKLVHVVVKNAPFELSLSYSFPPSFSSFESSSVSSILSFKRFNYDFNLLYDSSPSPSSQDPALKDSPSPSSSSAPPPPLKSDTRTDDDPANDKPVGFIRTKPIDFTIKSEENRVNFRVKIKTLSSQHEDMFFRLRLLMLDPQTGALVHPSMSVLSEPIKVISKSEPLMKKRASLQSQNPPLSSDQYGTFFSSGQGTSTANSPNSDGGDSNSPYSSASSTPDISLDQNSLSTSASSSSIPDTLAIIFSLNKPKFPTVVLHSLVGVSNRIHILNSQIARLRQQLDHLKASSPYSSGPSYYHPGDISFSSSSSAPDPSARSTISNSSNSSSAFASSSSSSADTEAPPFRNADQYPSHSSSSLSSNAHDQEHEVLNQEQFGMDSLSRLLIIYSSLSRDERIEQLRKIVRTCPASKLETMKKALRVFRRVQQMSSCSCRHCPYMMQLLQYGNTSMMLDSIFIDFSHNFAASEDFHSNPFSP